MADERVDLLIVGGNPASLSLAIEAKEAGVARVKILERTATVTPAEAVGIHGLSVEFGIQVERMADLDSEVEVSVSDGRVIHATAVAVGEIPPGDPLAPPFSVPQGLLGRVHYDTDGVPTGSDVLVVGSGTRAVEFTERLVQSGSHVVLALRGRFEDLSRLSQSELRRLERDRLVTILFHTGPGAIDDVDGYPMAVFEDRRTPDLQFDHVVFALGVEVHEDPFGVIGLDTRTGPDHVFILQDRSDLYLHENASVIPAGSAWDIIRDRRFQELAPARPSQPIVEADRIDALRREHYNATITRFEKAHSDLWIIRVQPDSGGASHRAGQYATLGLGYWEARIDSARDALRPGQSEKLIRRSYSISSPIFDDHGYLVDPHEEDTLEFYIVLVPPSVDRIPALTPRLALMEEGSRVYLGPKIAGRFTLDHVRDPACSVLFLATGTGEAPHNAMVCELLRKGHHGPIASVISTRYAADLGYEAKHRRLEERYDNYTYVPLLTREPGVPKRYIQEVIASGDLEERLGYGLEPASCQVYLCGNPAMIGPPTWENGSPVFSGAVSAVQVLTERGFTPDSRDRPGNVHFEEYW